MTMLLAPSIPALDPVALLWGFGTMLASYTIARFHVGPKPISGSLPAPLLSGGLKGLFVGHTFDDLDHLYGPGMDAYEAWCRDLNRCGWIKVMARGFLVTANPEDISFLLETKDLFVRDRMRYGILHRFLGDRQLIAPELPDDLHAMYRREFGQALSAQAMKGLEEMCCPNHLRVLLLELQRATHSGKGAAVVLEHHVAEAIMAILSQAAFNVSEPADMEEVSRATQQGVKATFKILRLVGLFDRLMLKHNALAADARERLQHLIERVSCTIRPEAKKVVVLDYMVKSKHLTSEDILDNCLTLMGGGYGTTVSIAISLFYFLSRHPEAQEKLFEELEPALALGTVPVASQLQGCAYLRNCIRETLRLQTGISTISREALVDTVLPGTNTFVPKGQIVVISIHAMHTHPAIWGPDAKEWIPERWERPGADETANRAFHSFGRGSGSCIGKEMALLKTQLLGAMLVRNFRIRWPDGQPPPILVEQPALQTETPSTYILEPRSQ